jgi:hypothetical protein
MRLIVVIAFVVLRILELHMYVPADILCELDSENLDSKEVCSPKAIKMVIQQILKQLK